MSGERLDAAHHAPPLDTDPDAGALLTRLRQALDGRYDVEREVGRGGMSIVFLARDIAHDRLVALKVLRPDRTASVPAARFLREIEIETRLHHPNILPMYDAGAAGGMPYYVMPYIEGESLRDRLKREGPLPFDEMIRIARDVGSALDYAHADGVVHRDIKPGNILLSGSKAVVADFGIARAITVVAGDELTESGLALGTPEYMSPEQATGDSHLDARTDIYSLGCVVHEMIAGEPPFTGPTAQAVIARHCHERPPSLHVVRPTVPETVERAVETALAKVPADRFATSAAFIEALERRETRVDGTVRWLRRHRAVAAGVGLGVLAASAAALRVVGSYAGALDPNRIVVFPLRDPAAPAELGGAGEEVATYIGYALDGTRPLTWLEGWDLSDGSARSALSAVAGRAAARLSRRARAAYYIDGSILRGPDSVTVVLRLHSVNGDSLVRRAGASSPLGVASLARLGLRAVADLLPALLEPGRTVDLSALSDRDPLAIAHFLQGERDYRRMRFQSALAHYNASVRQDSALALAALKGAQAANWLSRFGEDTAMIGIALRRADLLPPRQALLARGLGAYLRGNADSAVSYLTSLLSADSTSHAAWTLLGEVYVNLLPSSPAPDSLARAALQRAREAEPDFAPTLLLLEEVALRDGDVDKALALRRELRGADADARHELERDLRLRCVRDGPGSIDWPAAVRENPGAVTAAAKPLSVHAAQPRCARTAFEAVLGDRKVAGNFRWGALLGLQNLLVALGMHEEARALLDSEVAADLPARSLYILTAAAGGGFEREAAAAVDDRGRQYEDMAPALLWLLGVWESRHGTVGNLREITRVMRAKSDVSRTRRDSLLLRIMAARLTLAEGDTMRAIQQLHALRPTAPRGELAWQPWESLAGERMLLAQLLLARGEAQEADQVAGQLDAAEPVVHLLYLRPSLTIRLQAARMMQNDRLAARYQARLRRLEAHHGGGGGGGGM